LKRDSDVRFVKLRAIDSEIYQLESDRHRAAVERDEAERAAHAAAVEAARRNAPRAVAPIARLAAH
jgi:hypothetical protein